jgi:hypothetical protein
VIAEYRHYINRDLPLVERACTSKAGYDSRREASNRVRHGSHSDGSLAPYHCRWCERWHLGHRRHAA